MSEISPPIKHPGRTLLLLCAAQFMVILDVTVVNVALPSIRADLGIGVDDVQWVITAYALAFGGLLLLGGRAADVLGRRRMFLAGLAVFTVASLAAALAASPTALIAARVAQGVGAALLSPAALSLVTTTFPEGPQRQRALAAWAAVAAGGGAFGVLFGGALTSLFSWPAIFLINLPVGIAAAVGALRLVPRGARRRGEPIDAAGAVLATAGLVALIAGLVEAPDRGWGSAWTVGMVACATILLAAFVLVETRVSVPLVRLALLRRRTLVVSLVLMVAGMGTVLSSFFLLTIYLQDVLGHSALQTGLEFLPGALVLVAAAHAGGVLIAKVGAKPVLGGGMALGALGALLLSSIPADGAYLQDVLPGLLALDAGVGLAASGIFIVGMSGVADRETGLASGLITTGHEVGAALILPLLSTVALGDVGQEAGRAHAPAAVADGLGSGFAVAAVIALGAAVVAVVALRRADVSHQAHAAFAH